MRSATTIVALNASAFHPLLPHSSPGIHRGIVRSATSWSKMKISLHPIHHGAIATIQSRVIQVILPTVLCEHHLGVTVPGAQCKIAAYLLHLDDDDDRTRLELARDAKCSHPPRILIAKPHVCLAALRRTTFDTVTSPPPSPQSQSHADIPNHAAYPAITNRGAFR